MISRLRRFLESRGGLMAGVAFAIITLMIAVYCVWPDGQSQVVSDVNDQIWIDTDGNVFRHTLRPFDNSPVIGPTGRPGFRAELCYWTKDGHPKAQPTPVLLNAHINKPGPTFCPDCGRLVTALNPPPLPGVPDSQQHAPPTRAEYESRSSASIH